MHRQISIQDQLDEYREAAFDRPLSEELDIINYILEEWNDDTALKEAARYLRKHSGLMFDNTQSLSILFAE